jgi:hypothetical protein
MDYSQRELTEVEIHNLGMATDGSHHVHGSVILTVSNSIGGKEGPGVTVSLGVPFDPVGSIQDAELALLNGALALLKRFSSFSVDECQPLLLKGRAERIFHDTQS